MQLPAHATLEQATTLVKAIEEDLARLDTGAVLRVDAGALGGFDTSLLAVLLHARRLAQQAGRGFEVVRAPDKLPQLAQLYGVEDLLSFAPTGAQVDPASA